jgi:hypothetical protein
MVKFTYLTSLHVSPKHLSEITPFDCMNKQLAQPVVLTQGLQSIYSHVGTLHSRF